MLQVLNTLLTIVHLGIIGFNLFGWIPRATRKAHLVSLLLTAASWFLLGIWFGMGYCFFTDWQWKVKEKLGERNLPGNFIEYFSERITGNDFDPLFINNAIAVGFAIAVLLSVYVNLLKRKKGKKVVKNP